MSELTEQDIERAMYRAIIRALPTVVEAAIAFRALPVAKLREDLAGVLADALADYQCTGEDDQETLNAAIADADTNRRDVRVAPKRRQTRKTP